MPVTITKTVISETQKLVAADKKARDVTDSNAPGLILRVGITGATWSWKTEIAGVTYRLALGPVSEWTITEARTLAVLAMSMVRSKSGNPDAAWLHAQRAAKMGMAMPLPVEVMPEPDDKPPSQKMDFHWYSFSSARIVYLKEVERTLRADTLRDYRQLLEDAALAPLEKLKVSKITRDQVSRIIAVVHRSGRERYAEKMAGAIRTMWKFLEEDVPRARSGVEPGTMLLLRAPKATRKERGALPAKAKKSRYVPDMLEIGRIVAIARSGAFDEQQSTALELLVMTAQRRRPVVSCWKTDFKAVLDDTAGLWRQPPAHRKTAAMRDDGTDHTIPLPGPLWELVKKQRARSQGEWLFGQYRTRRAGMDSNFMSPEVMTRAFMMMPGIAATPHSIRRAFATHGEEKLQFSRLATKQVLDHSRGDDPSDVTAGSYALHNGTHATWPTMIKWCAYVESFVQPAIDADPRLLDVEWLKGQIASRRAEIMGLKFAEDEAA